MIYRALIMAKSLLKSESGSILHTARCEVLTLPYMESIELQPIHSYVVERLHFNCVVIKKLQLKFGFEPE